MGREKRKGRLNKTGDNTASTGAFIGFGAFANATSIAAAASASSSSTSTSTSSTANHSIHGSQSTIGELHKSSKSNNNTNKAPRLSPIYTGSDPTLGLLFPKIGQKRDATTKSKALSDLTDFFRDNSVAKKQKAEALSHFLYLFRTKLYYDRSSKVRACSVRLCLVASEECPKAWKNLVVGASGCGEAHNEIMGMVLCAKADSAAEVRAATAAVVGEEDSNSNSNNNNNNDDDDYDDNQKAAADAGLWGFAKKILSYNKPMDMHVDLFQKKGAAESSTKSTTKLSEAQQEELEERYERIVGTTIEGLRLHLLQQQQQQQQKPQNDNNNNTQSQHTVDDPSTIKYLWKTLVSPKASLRRQTYSLLSTVCQLDRTDLLDANKICKVLAQSLSSEKEAANIGLLLETVLAFVASNYEHSERSSILEQHFARPLSKLFKKGCHGAAPSSSWTPTILPLVALLPKKATDSNSNATTSVLPPRIDLLTNVWEGRIHVVGASDRCEVVRAVAETAAFLLAREESAKDENGDDDNDDDDNDCDCDTDVEAAFDQILAQCWIHALQSYLSTSGGTNNASRAHRGLGSTLAKGWMQLDLASRWNNNTNTNNNNTNHDDSGGKTKSKLPSIVYYLREWFWNEALPNAVLAKPTKNANLTQLLAGICARQQQISSSSSQLGSETLLWAAQALGRKFRSLFPESDPAWVPTKDVYNLWIAILDLVPSPPDQVFSSSSSDDDDNKKTNNVLLESFVMNRVLSWAVIHTSHLSDRCNKDLALLDVQLLHSLSVSVSANDSFRAWWGPILREILSAEPDLWILTDVLGWLGREGKHCAKDLTMMKDGNNDNDDHAAVEHSAFSKFCIETAQTAALVQMHTHADENTHHHHHHDEDSESEATTHHAEQDEDYRKTNRFLRACVGLDVQTIPEPLVGETVVDAWVGCACQGENSTAETTQKGNPVLATLVAMVRAKKLSTTQGESSSRIQHVLLQSWRQGGRLWEDQCLPWLLQEENTQRSSLIQNASRESKRCMEKISSTDLSSQGMDDDVAWNWTERAYELLRLCSNADGESSSVDLSSLGIVGLGDLSIWEEERRVDYLSTCLLRLIRHVRDVSSRWQLFVNSEADTLDLFVAVLIALSKGAESPLEADLARRRQDPCAMLLADLEVASFDSKVIKDSITCCVSKISALLERSTRSPTKVCQSIAVLSQLIEMRFVSVCPEPRNDPAQEKLNPSDVHVGDNIWYITNANDPFTQEPCVIAKIHNDLPEEVYFTIRLTRNGEQQERQTLGERLQKVRLIKTDEVINTEKRITVALNEIGDEEKREREQIVGPILDKLLKSIDATQMNAYYEIYNIVIAQCGLVSGRGIGSVHYSVVQKLMESQQRLLESLTSSDSSSAIAPTLWHLALALGFGMNAPGSQWSIPLIGLNAADSIPSLMAYDEDEEKETTKEIECAMAAWISVCASACDDAVLRTQSYSLLFDLATRLLCINNGDEYGMNPCHYIALRAIEAGQTESHKSKEGESLIQDSEAEALAELTRTFSTRWNNSEEERDFSTSWDSLPLFASIMRASLSKRPSLMAIASRPCLNALVKALYDPSKQRYAMLILQTYATEGRPLFDNADDDDLINSTTLERLDIWVKDMLEDEAGELEDDVASVAQWVCKEQMNDMESWHDDDDIDNEIACGRMLSWLSVLEIADAASGKDSSNRLAFTSYVSKCNAVDAMLDLALIYCNIGSDRKVKLDVVVSMEEIAESMSLSKLAARVIFRSVEVFPTLSKHWWDSSCPNYLTHTVREFVETQVSPDILKLAVQSIKNAAAFGEMQVKGSSVTREVNAAYVQDDFTLSVVIKLPLSFPFRRAEVDCSKTLGVPECRWKRWSLQITQMLNNQGGTLKDALLLWKENVDKEFEGVEPCPVCYSVLHVKSHKLPNLECNTCHNQFHSECLFEWFKNSGKSVCVICQQPWSGTRIQ